MVNSDIAISVRGLSKAYRIAHNEERHVTLAETVLARLKNPLKRATTETFWALKDVSFDIKKGDVVGIIGRNGAGKSTLLKILSRITEPTKGEIEVRGRIGSLLEVGTGFHPELTGRENIYLNGQILGMRKKEIDMQFDAIVAFAEVDQFIDTPVKRYSSGMYVRLAFGVAAHLKSEILVVDEVLAVGDAEFQKKCLGKMEHVARTGRTVLFVSHQESAVKRLCSSAILLGKGEVKYTGTPQDAFARYREQRAAGVFSTQNRTVQSKHVQFTGASISVDGITTSELNCAGTVRLTVEFDVIDRVKCVPEFVIRDANGVPVMFGGVWYSKGTTYVLEPGQYSFTYQVNLPYLVAGKYSIDLIMVEPNVRFYDFLEEALAVTISSSDSPATGFHFNQIYGRGCVYLDFFEAHPGSGGGRPTCVDVELVQS